MKNTLWILVLCLFMSCAKDDDLIPNSFPKYSNDSFAKELDRLDKYVSNTYPNADTVTNTSGFYYIVDPRYPGIEATPKSGNQVVYNITKKMIEGGETFFTTTSSINFDGFPNLDQPISGIISSDEMLSSTMTILSNMKIGQRVVYIFSSKYGYGTRENIYKIGENTSLEYEIELLGAGDTAVAQADENYVLKDLISKNQLADFTKSTNFIYYNILDSGDVKNNYLMGQTIEIEYSIKYLNDFETFFTDDASKGKKYSFVKGINDLPVKFNDCLNLIGKGGHLVAYACGEEKTKKIDFLPFNNVIKYEIKIK